MRIQQITHISQTRSQWTNKELRTDADFIFTFDTRTNTPISKTPTRTVSKFKCSALLSYSKYHLITSLSSLSAINPHSLASSGTRVAQRKRNQHGQSAESSVLSHFYKTILYTVKNKAHSRIHSPGCVARNRCEKSISSNTAGVLRQLCPPTSRGPSSSSLYMNRSDDRSFGEHYSSPRGKNGSEGTSVTSRIQFSVGALGREALEIDVMSVQVVLEQLCQVPPQRLKFRPAVWISMPASGYHPEQLASAVRRPLQSITVLHVPHDFPCRHVRVRCRTCGHRQIFPLSEG